MKNIKLLFSLILCIFSISCNTPSNPGSKESMAPFAQEPVFARAAKFAAPAAAADQAMAVNNEAVPEQAQTSPSSGPKKIIKDGRISIKTNDIVLGKKNVDALVKQFNGYYDNEELQNDDRNTSYDLKIRVPAKNFEELVAAIESGKDEIINKSIHSRDVTGEYIDIESRINSKREYLKRYKELLAKANTVKDILEIQENIRNLQEEIESREKQLKYLSDQVDFSTLDINLFKLKEYTYKPVQEDKFLERIKKSVSNGWSSFVSLVLWIISKWPYLLLIVAIYLIYKNKKKKQKNSKAVEQS